MGETNCIIHNATCRVITINLITEKADKDATWYQQALERHPMTKFLKGVKSGASSMKKKKDAPEVSIVSDGAFTSNVTSANVSNLGGVSTASSSATPVKSDHGTTDDGTSTSVAPSGGESVINDNESVMTGMTGVTGATSFASQRTEIRIAKSGKGANTVNVAGANSIPTAECQCEVVIQAGDMEIVPLEMFIDDQPKEKKKFAAVKEGNEDNEDAPVSDDDQLNTSTFDNPNEESDEDEYEKVKFTKCTFHYGVGENIEKAIGDTKLEAGTVVSFVCVESPIRVQYRSIPEQRWNNQIECVNDCLDTCQIKVEQKTSNFKMETGLDPGSKIGFQGTNPQTRKVYKRKAYFDDVYEVSVTPGSSSKAAKAELSNAAILRIEGMDL